MATTTRAHLPAALLVAAVLWLCAVAPPAAAARAGRKALYGAWTPIKDFSDPHIRGLGAWAVAEHAKRANDGLQFADVVSGEEQVVSGMNYRLVLRTTDYRGESAEYSAAVYEQLWTNTRVLSSFVPAN